MALKSFYNKYFNSLALLFILLIAAGIRLYHLNYQSLWIDEIASMNGSDPELIWQAVVQYSKADQPPAFFLLLHGWFKIFPFTDLSGRLFALLIGLAGIIAMYFLGKEVKDPRLGLAAAAITAFSYIHIFFSQDVRFYTLVFFTSTLSYLYFIRAIKFSRIPDFLLYVIFTTGVIYSHYFGLVVLASQGLLFLILVLLYSFSRKFILLGILSALAVTLLISPWIPVFFSDSQIKDFWIPPVPIYFLANYFYVYFKDIISAIVFAFLLILFVVRLYSTWRSERKLNPVSLVLLGSVTMSFLIPIVYSLLQTPVLNVRYTIIALPCLIIMISLGLHQVKKSFQNALLIATCCTSLFSLILIEKYYSKPLKEDWRGLVDHVIQKNSANDVVVSEQAWYCNYYFKTSQSSIRAVVPSEFTIDSFPKGVWWLDGFSTRFSQSEVELQLINRGYQLAGTDSLFLVRASYYVRPD